MITRVYTIYDRLAEESGPLFQAKNDEVAHRQYQTQLSTIQNIKVDDFTLLCVGEYDNERCEFQAAIPITIDEQLIQALQTKKEKSNYDIYRETAGPVTGGKNG